jgi:hypothetical protein
MSSGPSPAQVAVGTVGDMAEYDTPTPNTLLFRILPVPEAAAALRMLDDSGPEPGNTPVDPRWVFTLADVASGPDIRPIAAGQPGRAVRTVEPAGDLLLGDHRLA